MAKTKALSCVSFGPSDVHCDIGGLARAKTIRPSSTPAASQIPQPMMTLPGGARSLLAVARRGKRLSGKQKLSFGELSREGEEKTNENEVRYSGRHPRRGDDGSVRSG